MNRRRFLALVTSAVSANTLLPAAFARSHMARAVEDSSVRFIAFGDMGTGDKAQFELARAMAAHHEERPFDTALMLGDNIYPDGNISDVVAKFERPYAELLRRGVKFQAVLGNHDVRKGREAQINYPKFNMGGRPYYTFTKGAGLVQFFALDSNDFTSRQRAWLEKALSDSQARWKVAFFHHPIYSSGSTHGSDKGLRAKLEPLFASYNVTAVFSGHDHIYERTVPQKGVQYFVSGAGGKLRRGDLKSNSPFLAYGNDEVSSFMSIDITQDKFTFQAIDSNGRVLDNGEIAPSQTLRKAA